MNFKFFLKNIRQKYNTVSYFDLSYIIYKVIGISKEDILIYDKEISKKDMSKIEDILNTFVNGKPLNKIFNEQNFFGLNFFVNENVLAPRFETEILVENAISMIDNNNVNVLDLCCGSGCIGLTIKKFCPNCNITLSDISKKALEVCNINAKKLNINDNNCKIIESDLFENIDEKFDFILSNPPYIKLNNNNVSKEVLLYDPHIALFGGEDGLLFYKKILENAKNYLNDDGIILFEIGYDICQDVLNLIKNYDFICQRIVKDYNNIDRVLILKRSK